MAKNSNSNTAPAATRTARKGKATASVAAELAAELMAQPLPAVEQVEQNTPAVEQADAPAAAPAVEQNTPAADAPDAVFAATLAMAQNMLANMTAEQLLALVNGKAMKAPRAPRAPRADGAATGSRKAVGSVAELLAAKLAEQPVLTLTVADRVALGLANSAVVHRAYWAPCNPGGKAAAAAGATVKSVKNGDGFDVVLTRAA